MLINVQCFWLEPTDRQRRSLRRFTFSSDKECPNCSMGHDASVGIEDGSDVLTEIDGRLYHGSPKVSEYAGDSRWPIKCEFCDYVFQQDDEWQANGHQIHSTTTGLGEMTVQESPAGGMWDATNWTPDRWRGPDGRCIAIKLPPGGPHDFWLIDGPTSKKADEPDTFWTRVGSTFPDISVTPVNSHE